MFSTMPLRVMLKTEVANMAAKKRTRLARHLKVLCGRIAKGVRTDGVLYTLLRLTLSVLGYPANRLHRQFKRPFIRWDERRNEKKNIEDHVCEAVSIELWATLGLLVNGFVVLPLLTMPLPAWLVLSLTAVVVFRLADMLSFLLEHHIPRKTRQRSAGRALVLTVVNYIETAVIFASLLLANARFGGADLNKLPSASRALDISFRGILSGRFGDLELEGWISNWGFLSGTELGVGLFILLVVVVQVISYRPENDGIW
ncbi:MAG: hypothetical protein JSU87_15215 [Gemmatimonadota bacterium]|nr:MAG: hypothetical protein JSU87_15215 [Gemmatimonadota bacterium]